MPRSLAMNHDDVNRQLLLGLLAFQNNFIDQRALLTAFATWSRKRTQPLGELLVGEQAVNREQLQLLEALVVQFLAKFGNDVEQGLANISSVDASLRDELNTLADPQMRASLTMVGTAKDTPPPDPLNTQVPSVGRGTSQGARFRILRPHARGGLGEVFVAEDGELHREVALKQIKTRHADDLPSRAKFMFEAEVTGGLEHPNIVPVYGLGAYEDGRPFYAMRFIRGDNLRHAIARYYDPKRKLPASSWTLEFRNLLQRFLDVCNAVDYAHSRGVLHRDLKPENVMLGHYGETLLVDWGLAKATGKPSLGTERPLSVHSGGGTQTIDGTAVGTPPYMSPEQAAGRIDELTEASDVYSLGATLYEILTGRPPVDGSEVSEVLQKVERGEFPRPRELRPDVPRGLEAVCLKAMALKPADRYPSARALADDIENWLADERVGAYAEPLSAEIGRWTRKHRTAVVGAAMLLVTAVVGLVVGLAAVAAEQNETEKQRELAVAGQKDAEDQRRAAETARDAEAEQRRRAQAAEQAANAALDMAKQSELQARTDRDRAVAAEQVAQMEKMRAETSAKQAIEARVAAETARKEADMQRMRADEQRDEVLDTLGDFVFDVQDELQDLPGLQPLKDRLLELAIARLDNIEKSGVEDLVERTNAAAQFKRAEILITSGKAEEGRKILADVQSIFEGLAKSAPASREARHDLAIVYQRLGDSFSRLNLDPVQTRKFYLDSGEVLKSLRNEPARESPTAAEVGRDLAVAYGRLGDLGSIAGDDGAPRDWYEMSLEIRKELLPNWPASPPTDAAARRELVRAARDLALAYDRLGDLELKLHAVAAARLNFEAGRALREKIAALDACGLRSKYDMAVSEQYLGECEFAEKHYEAAAAKFAHTLQATQVMAELDACNLDVQRTLSLALERLGNAVLRLENFDDARKHFERCLEIRLNAGGSPTDGQRQDLAIAYYNLGKACAGQGDADDARQNFEAVRRTVATSEANDQAAQNTLAGAVEALGDLDFAAKKYADAQPQYREALKIREEHAPAGDPSDVRQRAILRKKLGMTFHAESKFDEALAEYAAAQKLRRDSVADPIDADLTLLIDAARKKEFPRPPDDDAKP